MVTNGARYACEFRSRARAFAPGPICIFVRLLKERNEAAN
jgi:hypothetical protein